jgi:hypothetical protein
VPRRNWDTGEAPYTIRQSGHLERLRDVRRLAPRARGTGGGWPWYAIIGTTLTLAIGTAVLHFLH